MVKNALEWPSGTESHCPFDEARRQFDFEDIDTAKAWYLQNEFCDEWSGAVSADELGAGISSGTIKTWAFSRLLCEIWIGHRARTEPMWKEWADYLDYWGAVIVCPAVAVHMARLAEQKKTYRQGRGKGVRAGNETYRNLERQTGAAQSNVGFQTYFLLLEYQRQGKDQPLQWAVRDIAEKYGLAMKTVKNIYHENGPYVVL